MADTTTTRPYGRTRRTCPDRAGWAGLCARYEVLAARMGMAATEAGAIVQNIILFSSVRVVHDAMTLAERNSVPRTRP